MSMNTKFISKAIEILGLGPMASVCGVSYQAVRKWEKAGRLPRTEWTGETDYANLIQVATKGKVKRKELLKLLKS